MEKETEGKRLTRLIEGRGVSVYKFAQDIDEKVQVVQNWISRDSISKKKLIKVSDYFGVTTDYILKGK